MLNVHIRPHSGTVAITFGTAPTAYLTAQDARDMSAALLCASFYADNRTEDEGWRYQFPDARRERAND